MATAPHRSQIFGKRIIRKQAHHILPRHHHLTGHPVRKIKHIINHTAFNMVDFALLLAGADNAAQLILAPSHVLHGLFDMQKLLHSQGGLAGHQHKGIEEIMEKNHCVDGFQHRPFHITFCHGTGHQLAPHHVQQNHKNNTKGPSKINIQGPKNVEQLGKKASTQNA